MRGRQRYRVKGIGSRKAGIREQGTEKLGLRDRARRRVQPSEWLRSNMLRSEGRGIGWISGLIPNLGIGERRLDVGCEGYADTVEGMIDATGQLLHAHGCGKGDEGDD